MFIYRTSVTYARRHIFNIQGRPHAITVQLREQNKCEHVADSQQSAQPVASYPGVFSESTEEQRQRRLQRRRERERARRASETAQQREERLGRRRVRDKARRTEQQRQAGRNEESVQEREARLLQLRVNQRERLATESTEQREARLQQVRANQRERQAAESLQERESRLLQLSVNQRQRLATESLEEREHRLQRDRERETPITTEQFKQPCVQLKMKRFHECFTSLSSHKCFTCSCFMTRARGRHRQCACVGQNRHPPLHSRSGSPHSCSACH